MQQLKEKLLALPSGSNIAKMVEKSNSRPKAAFKKKQFKTKKVLSTLYTGFEGSYACSDLELRPGTPVNFKGRQMRVCWHLRGNQEYVVLKSDVVSRKGQEIITRPESVGPCDCQGYIHGRVCRK